MLSIMNRAPEPEYDVIFNGTTERECVKRNQWHPPPAARPVGYPSTRHAAGTRTLAAFLEQFPQWWTVEQLRRLLPTVPEITIRAGLDRLYNHRNVERMFARTSKVNPQQYRWVGR